MFLKLNEFRLKIRENLLFSKTGERWLEENQLKVKLLSKRGQKSYNRLVFYDVRGQHQLLSWSSLRSSPTIDELLVLQEVNKDNCSYKFEFKKTW